MKHRHGLLLCIGLLAGVCPAPAQVTNLGIATAHNQTVLYWPTTLPNYVLQSTTNPASANWVTVSNAVLLNAVTVTNGSPAGYFRLVQIPSPDGLAFIPAGAFTMGDSLDGEPDAIPTVTAYVSAFYMDTNLVTDSEWQAVYNWATNNGYTFTNTGAGKAANHPVQLVDWYDSVKWCNARSQQAGLTPVYYSDAGLTMLYTNGEAPPYVNWTNNGYRLPTEAEWEKAARGGLDGQRFPWGETISESQANYKGDTTRSYDSGPNGYNSTFDTGAQPYTSPAGYFAPNGYGLYDMAGNVWEWCWDWYGTPYSGGGDPRGPTAGTYRVCRGGDWNFGPQDATCAARYDLKPIYSFFSNGFRCVRGQ